MQRLADWDRRFHAWHAQWRRRAHVWGESDCGCMVAAAIMAITAAPDPMADLRGRYSTAAGNARVLKRMGFASPADYAASKFAEHASPVLARRGDIGACAGLPGEPLVVVAGHSLLSIGPDGLVPLARRELTRAFIIG